jgi:hypothetical protein
MVLGPVNTPAERHALGRLWKSGSGIRTPTHACLTSSGASPGGTAMMRIYARDNLFSCLRPDAHSAS